VFKLLKRLVAALVLAGAVLGLAYLFRAPLLRAGADLWIVNQTASPADAIVVLGGGLESRPFAAAKLYHAGLAPRVVLMNVRPGPATELGVLPAEAVLTRQVLVAEGVAETNLVALGNGVATSYDEALAVRDWVRQTGARRLLIVTDLFHTRRVSWLYAKELAGLNVSTRVVAATQRQYTAADWWCHEEGLIAFQNEVIKFAYYRLKY
jgi:uncharacterized SAM-binding protein YcdF (DUF218 family)